MGHLSWLIGAGAALATVTACGSSDGRADPSGGITIGGDAGTGPGPGAGDSGSPATGDGTADGAEGQHTKFDLGVNSDWCVNKAAGIYCDNKTAITCDGDGRATDVMQCLPDECKDAEGCVACEAGEFACQGPRVMSCDTTGPTPQWEQVEVCDPGAGMVCESSVGMCVPLAPIGGTTPTGEYYQYSVFDLTSAGFYSVSDVDTYGDRLYFTATSAAGALVVGVYDVGLLDSDGDGLLEPNQHPSYPEQQGPVEERTFTLVTSFPIDNPGGFPNNMELYAKANSVVFSGPNGLREYDLLAGTYSQVAPMPTWIGTTLYNWIAFVGYDEVGDVWYSGNESARRVFQYDGETQTWGYAFEFPALAGDHMDGIEVVTDVSTGTPYVYVSDMTSNFIGQYRHDRDAGWVQENLFSYVETTGALVEGFGFGALNHFWCGSLVSTFYELGGGDLTQYIEPPG